MSLPDVTRKPVHSLISRERVRAIRELHELITALDRRVPQVPRAGEVAVTRSGEELRAAVLRRIHELERGATEGGLH